MGNKSQKSGRVVLQERKGRGEQVGHANTTFPEMGMVEQNESGRKWGRENKTLKILIKIKMLSGSFRKSSE